MKKAIMQSSFTFNFKGIKMTTLNTAENRKLRAAKQVRMLSAHSLKRLDRFEGRGIPRGTARNKRRIFL
jgi:hypothetical protein